MAQVKVEIDEPEPGKFIYRLLWPMFAKHEDGKSEFSPPLDDGLPRGSFATKEEALASSKTVIALMWPEPPLSS